LIFIKTISGNDYRDRGYFFELSPVLVEWWRHLGLGEHCAREHHFHLNERPCNQSLRDFLERCGTEVDARPKGGPPREAPQKSLRKLTNSTDSKIQVRLPAADS